MKFYDSSQCLGHGYSTESNNATFPSDGRVNGWLCLNGFSTKNLCPKTCIGLETTLANGASALAHLHRDAQESDDITTLKITLMKDQRSSVQKALFKIPCMDNIAEAYSWRT